jgi:hypothetical protein
MDGVICKDLIREVARKTGEPEEVVEDVAARYGDLIVRLSRSGVVCLWAFVRCITCIGPARRVFWCLVSSACAIA